MNWGKSITVALVLFIGFIMTMVVIMINHEVDLETEDYYQKDLNYDQIVDAKSNAEQLEEKITLRVIESNLEIKIPNKQDSISNVTIQLKRPNNKKGDMSFDLKTQSLFKIPVNSLEKGIYKVTFSYDSRFGKCVQEHKVKI